MRVATFNSYVTHKSDGSRFIINAPIFDSVVRYSTAGTWSDLVNALGSSYIPEATMLVSTYEDYSAILAITGMSGFPHIIAQDNNGNTFMLSNGNYITITYEERNSFGVAVFQNSDGVSLQSVSSQHTTDGIYWQSLISVGAAPGYNRTGYAHFFIRTSNNRVSLVNGVYPNVFTSAQIAATTFYDNADKAQPLDPYSPGGTSEPGGGGGTFDDSSDTVTDSALPTLSAANTGFTRIYNPTLAQVQALANYMWTNDDFLTLLKNKIIQLVENPMDAIIAFNLLPCSIPDGGTQEFKVMYIPTGINMTVAAQQFIDVDCGTVKLEPYYGSALDYSPYTKVSIFLPYIGNVQISTDECMGATLQVKYRIDIVSGGCVAKILVDGNVLYQYSGHCAITIPVTSADFSRYVSAMINVAKVAIGAAAGVPIGGKVAGEAVMQQTGQIVNTQEKINPVSGEVQRLVHTSAVYDVKQPPTKASFGDWAKETAANTVGAVMGSKPNIEHAGSFSGNTGYLGVRRPYLIIERPRMCNPPEYGTFNGFPSMLYLSLGACSGYTEVQSVQLTGITATNPELAEIGEMLRKGVLL